MLSALALADCALPSLPRAARWRRGAEKHCPRGARHPTPPPKKNRYLARHDTGVRLRIRLALFLFSKLKRGTSAFFPGFWPPENTAYKPPKRAAAATGPDTKNRQ